MSEQSKTKYVIVWVEKDCDNDIDDLGTDGMLYDTEEEAKVHKGRHLSEEHRMKIAKGNKGR